MPDRLVYSSDGGRVTTCQTCGQPYTRCRCNQSQAAQPSKTYDGTVRVLRERKGRGGKTVTLITGIPADDATIAALAQQLKKLCGSGGTVKDGVIEIQGDHCEKLIKKLVAMGYRAKKVGG